MPIAVTRGGTHAIAVALGARKTIETSTFAILTDTVFTTRKRARECVIQNRLTRNTTESRVASAVSVRSTGRVSACTPPVARFDRQVAILWNKRRRKTAINNIDPEGRARDPPGHVEVIVARARLQVRFNVVLFTRYKLNLGGLGWVLRVFIGAGRVDIVVVGNYVQLLVGVVR
jgi:hypothetical protein